MRNRIRSSVAASVFAFALLWSATGSSDPTSWTFTSIDVPGADQTSARDMNESGQIVGHYHSAQDGDRGYLLSNGVFTPIWIGDANDARGINSEGEIVGWFFNVDDGYYSHAYLLSNGSVKQIDYPGAYYTIAHAVNAAGDIVGFWGTSDFTEEHGFLLRKGVLSTIDYPGAALTNARGINDKGDIVGIYEEVTGRSHGFLLSRDGTFTTVNGPGTPGGNANGINTRGEIVGEYSLPTAPGYRFGFLLRRGEYTTIKYPGVMITHPWQITSDGQHIVGQYNDEQGFAHGFVLSRKPLK